MGKQATKKGLTVFSRKSLAIMVPEAGLEPARLFSPQILSLLCMPFHHSGACSERLMYSGRGLKAILWVRNSADCQ
jgi:hypothetical protein